MPRSASVSSMAATAILVESIVSSISPSQAAPAHHDLDVSPS